MSRSAVRVRGSMRRFPRAAGAIAAPAPTRGGLRVGSPKAQLSAESAGPPTAKAGSERVGALLYLYLGAVLLPVWFHVGPLYLSLLRLLLLVVILPVLFKLLRGGYGRVLPTDYLFIAHILWAAVALAVNNPDQMVEQVGSVGMEFLGGYAVGRACIRSKAQFLTMCKVLLVTVLLLVPFSFYETLTGNPLVVRWIEALPGLRSVAPVYTAGRLGLERVQSVFAHPIHHGLFCSVVFSLVFVGLRGTISDTWRWFGSALVLVTGFLGLASGAFLAMLFQIFLICWAATFQGMKARWWLLVGLISVAYVAVDVISNRTAVQVFLSYATFSAYTAFLRVLIFEWGLAHVIGSNEKGIVGSPLFGIGMNDWVRPSFMSGSMDNFWLVMAVRYGLPGFLFLAIGYGWALWKVMHCNLKTEQVLADIRLAWVFTFAGLTFTLCTVHVWTSIYSFTFFIFGAGIWLLDVAAEPRRKGVSHALGLPTRDQHSPATSAERLDLHGQISRGMAVAPSRRGQFSRQWT